MPYIWYCKDLPAEWWDKHTITIETEPFEPPRQIVRVYGNNPTTIRFADLSLRHAQPSDYVMITRKPPAGDEEWEYYREIAQRQYPRLSVVIATDYGSAHHDVRMVTPEGSWGSLPSMIDLNETVFVTLDELDRFASLTPDR